MNTAKENSKAAFNQQAATYDKDIKGQHARSLYPVILSNRDTSQQNTSKTGINALKSDDIISCYIIEQGYFPTKHLQNRYQRSQER